MKFSYSVTGRNLEDINPCKRQKNSYSLDLYHPISPSNQSPAQENIDKKKKNDANDDDDDDNLLIDWENHEPFKPISFSQPSFLFEFPSTTNPSALHTNPFPFLSSPSKISKTSFNKGRSPLKQINANIPTSKSYSEKNVHEKSGLLLLPRMNINNVICLTDSGSESNSETGSESNSKSKPKSKPESISEECGSETGSELKSDKCGSLTGSESKLEKCGSQTGSESHSGSDLEFFETNPKKCSVREEAIKDSSSFLLEDDVFCYSPIPNLPDRSPSSPPLSPLYFPLPSPISHSSPSPSPSPSPPLPSTFTSSLTNLTPQLPDSIPTSELTEDEIFNQNREEEEEEEEEEEKREEDVCILLNSPFQPTHPNPCQQKFNLNSNHIHAFDASFYHSNEWMHKHTNVSTCHNPSIITSSSSSSPVSSLLSSLSSSSSSHSLSTSLSPSFVNKNKYHMQVNKSKTFSALINCSSVINYNCMKYGEEKEVDGGGRAGGGGGHVCLKDGRGKGNKDRRKDSMNRIRDDLKGLDKEEIKKKKEERKKNKEVMKMQKDLMEEENKWLRGKDAVIKCKTIIHGSISSILLSEITKKFSEKSYPFEVSNHGMQNCIVWKRERLDVSSREEYSQNGQRNQIDQSNQNGQNSQNDQTNHSNCNCENCHNCKNGQSRANCPNGYNRPNEQTNDWNCKDWSKQSTSRLNIMEEEVDYVAIIIECKEFVHMIMHNLVDEHYANVRKLYSSHIICYIINKMHYTTKSRKKKSKEGDNKQDEIFSIQKKVAEMSVRLQNVRVRLCFHEMEVAEHLCGIHRMLAEMPYRRKLSKLQVFSNGGMKNGDAFYDVIKSDPWKRALVCIPGVCARDAIAISAAYPSMSALLKAYKSLPSVNERRMLLSSLSKVEDIDAESNQRRQKVGQAVSKKVFAIFCSF